MSMRFPTTPCSRVSTEGDRSRSRRRALSRLSIVVGGILSLALPSPAAAQTVDVMSHGWHTGIVIPVDARSSALIPALRHFQEYRWVEVSWGDERFFRAGAISPILTLRALLWPTPTVLHIDGFLSPSDIEYEKSPLIRFTLTDRVFRELCKSIADDFEGAEPLSVGRYETSYFFRAKGRYTLLRTCNVWTLEKLASANLETSPRLGLRAEVAMRQIASQGEVLRAPPREPKWPYLMASVATLALMIRSRREWHARRASVWEAAPSDSAAEAVAAGHDAALPRTTAESEGGKATRDRALRRAWAVVGISAVVMFLATILVANHFTGFRMIVRVGLIAFISGWVTIAVVSADRLRCEVRCRPISAWVDALQLLAAAAVIAVIFSPM